MGAAPPSAPGAWWAPVAVALLLRALQALLRWDEVTWMYAAYHGPVVDALAAGDGAGLLRFVGLHPPLFGLWRALCERWVPVPLVWLGVQALVSTAAVAVLARRWPLGAWVLATAPVQVHHGAELNNYPWVALLAAAAWPAREAALAGRWGALAALGVLGAWTHGLAGVVLGLVVLSLGPRGARAPLAVMALGAAPLLPQVLELGREPSTWAQPPFRPGLVLEDWVERFGLLGLGLAPWVLWGAARARATAGVALGTALFVLALQAAGVAAPHQTPYWVALGPPLALLVQAGAQSPRARAWVLAVVLAQGGWQLAFGLQRAAQLAAPGPRGIDQVLARAQPGDALLLLAPPGLNDDDKRRSSPTLWRLRPWWPMPMARPYPFAYDDFRHGQPRVVRGLTVYVHDEPRAELEQALAAHPRGWVVVYEHRDNPRYTTELAARLGGEWALVGGEWVGGW